MAEDEEGTGSEDLDESKVEAIVRKVVPDILKSLIGKDGKVTEEEEPEPTPKGRRTLREEEGDVSAAVRAEVARIKAQEAHDAEHAKLKEKAEEKAPAVPVKRPKASTFLWGA